MASSSHVENLYFKTFCSFTILVTSAGMYWGGESFEVHSGEYYCGKSFAGTFWPTDSLDVHILYSVFLHHFLFDFRACVPSTNLWKFVVVKSVCTWCSVYGRSSVHSSKKTTTKNNNNNKKAHTLQKKICTEIVKPKSDCWLEVSSTLPLCFQWKKNLFQYVVAATTKNFFSIAQSLLFQILI